MKLIFLTALCLLISMWTPLHGQTVQEAEQLMAEGRYADAAAMLDELIATTKANNAGQLNMLAGECALKLKNTDAAENYFNKAAQRGVADAYLHLGRSAMMRYDFAKAGELYRKYVALREKAGKDTSAGTAALERVAAARDMLDRVEHLVFIDSIDVPVENIYGNIILAPEAGRIFMGENGRQGFESSDRRLRYTVDRQGDSTFVSEQILLLSGDYDAPRQIMDGEDAGFPFMMPDGCTFYFSSQREGGLGGLDIYRSNRDSEDGSFMGAVNMGMPYNSPANDYFLAIDEYTGVGWLATDRNFPDSGAATIYTFVPNEVRQNYPVDTPDLISLARIESITATQQPGTDYSPLLQRIDSIADAPAPTAPRFSFTMPDGRVVTEFRNNATLNEVRQYQKDREALDVRLSELDAMRRRYAAAPDSSLASEIIKAEQEVESFRRRLRERQQLIILKLTD